MKKMLLCLSVMALALKSTLGAQDQAAGEGQGEAKVKIAIRVGGTRVTATMLDSPAARDFVALLPLTLELSDYSGTEKVAGLPGRLSTDKAPRGFDPSVGDIAYYAPWGNLALYYNDFGYSPGLVPLGRLDSGVEPFKTGGSVIATFEPLR